MFFDVAELNREFFQKFCGCRRPRAASPPAAEAAAAAAAAKFLRKNEKTSYLLGRRVTVQSGRSTITHRRIIDRTERITEPTEPNLTKNQKNIVLVFRRFFGLQASYRAETLTPDRSRAPRRGQKIQKSKKLSNRSNRSARSSDRAIDRINRRPP